MGENLEIGYLKFEVFDLTSYLYIYAVLNLISLRQKE